MSVVDPRGHALVVVDAQLAFDEPPEASAASPECDANIAALIEAWQRAGSPVVVVHHDSVEPDSALGPGRPGNADKPFVPRAPNLRVVKSVNSAFHGEPDLHAWLTGAGVDGIVVCGYTTNHCCETTARVGGNLGHSVYFVLDATGTIDRAGPDGVVVTAAELTRATAASLHGEFATVVTTADVLAATGG